MSGRIITKQFGRSWWIASVGGKYVATGKTSREAHELAMQKLSQHHVRRRADNMPDLPKNDLEG